MLVQLQQLDSAAHVANSRYQAATAQLQLVQQQLSENKQALGVARGNLAAAQKALAQRLVAIYTSQDSESSLAVILGAQSLDDLVNRLETQNTVTTQNSSLIQQVASYERSIVRHRQLLHSARRSVGRLVAERAAAKHAIDAKLAAEQRLYNSVRAEIAQLQAAAARQPARRGAAGPGSGARATDAVGARRQRRSPAGTSRATATAARSGSRSSTSASRTSGVARVRAGSTARGS